MQQRKRGSTLGDYEAGHEAVVVRRSPLVYVPLLLVFILIPGYLLYMGRSEIFDAVHGAKAYIYTSLWEQVGDLTGQEIYELQPVHEVRVITEITLDDGSKMQILEEPVPEDCYPEAHADYDGFAVRWGLNHKTKSAAECCRRCKEFEPTGDVPHRCNVWAWCGDPSGVCWTMDIHNHTTGDCWLKFQAGWDGNTDRTATNLRVNHRGRFSDEFKSEHKSAPEWVPWTAGVIPPVALPDAASAGAADATPATRLRR